MRTSPKKVRLSVYLEPKLLDALTAHATRRDLSLSVVAEAAIASFLSPDADERREASMSRRLDRLDRQVARMERDLGISLETLALVIRYWMTVSPPLPEPAAAAARAQGVERYEAFVAALGRRLSRGPVFRQEIPDDVPPAPET